jgi:hypothetical protein
MKPLSLCVVALVAASAIAGRADAEDPQTSVERTRQAICGEWTIKSIHGPHFALDSSWFDGIKWIIGDKVLTALPGSKESQQIVGGIRLDFDLRLHDRSDRFGGALSLRYAKKWSDAGPYSFDITCEHKGETIKLHGILKLDEDCLTVSFGSRNGRPTGFEYGKTGLGVYVLERVVSPNDEYHR